MIQVSEWIRFYGHGSGQLTEIIRFYGRKIQVSEFFYCAQNSVLGITRRAGQLGMCRLGFLEMMRGLGLEDDFRSGCAMRNVSQPNDQRLK